jgi:hypothetical protein
MRRETFFGDGDGTFGHLAAQDRAQELFLRW